MSFLSELKVYVGRAREFSARDWLVYVAWVGLMLGLVCATGGFLIAGRRGGVSFPAEAWLVPLGAVVFTLSIAVDTIGHRTVYKQAISGAEGLVHAITIFCGIGSCVLLTAAFDHRKSMWIPAAVLTGLSFVYSLVDEAFHWRRYVRQYADRIEMCSHVGILIGHSTMMVAWWAWFFEGYSGVRETLGYFGSAG